MALGKIGKEFFKLAKLQAFKKNVGKNLKMFQWAEKTGRKLPMAKGTKYVDIKKAQKLYDKAMSKTKKKSTGGHIVGGKFLRQGDVR